MPREDPVTMADLPERERDGGRSKDLGDIMTTKIAESN
jgi:hypothetical protein